MTEREMLEAAARAMDLELTWPSDEGLSPRRKDVWALWNPRRHDGDSFELAAALRISVEHNHPADNQPWVCASVDAATGNRARLFMEDVPDESQRAAAMRLAIVRCAAAQASGEAE